MSNLRKPRNSTKVLKNLPGILDIKRHSPIVLYIWFCNNVRIRVAVRVANTSKPLEKFNVSNINNNPFCLMEFPGLDNWTNSFRFWGLLSSNFHFYFNFNRIFCKQTVKICTVQG